MRPNGPTSIRGCWLFRVLRGAWPDRNPLRRGIDRLETCLLVGLFVVLAVATPFAARLAGHASYVSALQARQEQLATRHLVRAVLTEDVARVSGYSTYVLAQATWTSVSGVHRSGGILAVSGSPKGTAITVWTDGGGNLDNPPLTLDEVVGQADAATTGVIIGAAAGYLAAAGVIRRLLNRRRIAAWEADWVVTAPTWNRQSW